MSHFNLTITYFSACNRYLVTSSDGVTDDKITASSVYNGTALKEIHSPSRARLNSEEILTPKGVLASAWVADINDMETPWIQVGTNILMYSALQKFEHTRKSECSFKNTYCQTQILFDTYTKLWRNLHQSK